jgi:hypothetical protein
VASCEQEAHPFAPALLSRANIPKFYDRQIPPKRSIEHGHPPHHLDAPVDTRLVPIRWLPSCQRLVMAYSVGHQVKVRPSGRKIGWSKTPILPEPDRRFREASVHTHRYAHNDAFGFAVLREVVQFQFFVRRDRIFGSVHCTARVPGEKDDSALRQQSDPSPQIR